MKAFLFIILFSSLLVQSFSQELQCQIQLSTQQIEGTDKRIYQTLQTALYEFLNNRKWSNRNFRMEERIECTMVLTLTERLGSQDFRGTLNVVVRRPVLNAAYNSVLLNLLDKDIQFSYVESQPLDYSEGSFTSNLTSVLAYYVYLILGVEFDSYSPSGGSPFFEKAQAVVNSAQGAAETGWKAYEGTRNRYWIVENFMNPGNSPIRDFYYKFHRQGLDQMYERVDQGRSGVTESIDDLKTMYDSKPDLYALTLILDAKRDEFVNIYSDQRVPPMEKTSVVNILKEIDPANSSKYQTILGP
jgi:hypothetical protein